MKRMIFLLLITAVAFGQDVSKRHMFAAQKRLQERQKTESQTQVVSQPVMKTTNVTSRTGERLSISISSTSVENWYEQVRIYAGRCDKETLVKKYQEVNDKYMLYRVSCRNNGSSSVEWLPKYYDFESNGVSVSKVTYGSYVGSIYGDYLRNFRGLTVAPGKTRSFFVLLPRTAGTLRVVKSYGGARMVVATL